MNKKILVFGILFLAVFLSGCNETEYLGQYDNPNTGYYDSANDSDSEACGNSGQSCCQYVGTDEFGMITGRYYCNQGLECRMETCVEGADYQAYDRTNIYN